MTRQLLRIATAGSVDDGKSTLIGRLMHDTDSLPLDHLEAVKDEEGVADLAALSDGLRAEREQGITIDVAYRFFSTERAATSWPTHPATSATRATCSPALPTRTWRCCWWTPAPVCCARPAGTPASRNCLASSTSSPPSTRSTWWTSTRAGSARSKRSCRRWLRGSAARNCPSSRSPPSSATTSCTARTNTPWYTGPTLLEYLEGVELSAPQPEAAKLRLPIQWVSRPTADERRRYTGRLAAGTLSVGDAVVSLPAGTRSTVTAVDTLDDDRTTAVAPLSVSIELADDIDVGRGDVFVSGADDATLPVLARELDATVCWFAETPLRAGDRVALKQTTRTVRATVQALHSRLDPETLDELDNPVELALNDIGSVTLRTSSVVVADSYSDNRDSGAFILIDETIERHHRRGHHHRAARGQARRADPQRHPLAPFVTRSGLPLEATGQRGATIWFTGLPASGKSTVAVAVERALVESGDVAYLLDGDNIRHGLSDDLGFSAGDRAENIRRVGHLTRLFADAGVVALASLVSPLKSDREIARALNDAAKLPFIEVYICTSVEECEKRDPKGLYARARAGELKGLTGVDAPYEAPENADLVLDTTGARHRRAGGAGARGAEGQADLTPQLEGRR